MASENIERMKMRSGWLEMRRLSPSRQGLGPKAGFQIFLAIIGVIVVLIGLTNVNSPGEQAVYIGTGFAFIGIGGVVEVGGPGGKIVGPVGAVIVVVGILILAHVLPF